MIGIVNYGLGNIRAFANVYRQLDIPFRILESAQDFEQVTHLVLPGVGAFDQAMKRLDRSGMRERLEHSVLHLGTPLLGVCVGLQILMRESEEGSAKGLGWIEGDVVRFQLENRTSRLELPHMGWNLCRPLAASALFQDFDADAYFYFLHSYRVRCDLPANELARSDYGGEFTCAAQRENILGVQFHPEKSHSAGTRLLQNFARV